MYHSSVGLIKVCIPVQVLHQSVIHTVFMCEVENELHFLCVCTTYSNYRQNLYSIVINDNFLNMSNDEKFVFLLKFKWKYVCIYLEKAWDKRTEI